MELSTRYAPSETEDKWYEYWEKQGYFRSVPDEREPFTIVIPPPNVTGVLHMGHMLNNTIQDILVRKARLDGKNACWVPGTDHASIATEAKVVRWLREDMNLRKADLTRDQFMEYAYQWKDKYGGIILQQLRKLGASCDWERTAFTMDKGYYDDVIRVFVDLYQKDKLYRGLRMVNWDPVAKTVLSNEEVLHKEEQSQLFYIQYALEGAQDASEGIVIATQRPETIFADVAICVNPNDPRYAALVGKNVLIPLINRPIPVIADDYVDVEFGTGALKITPAHDPNDYEIGLRYNLEVIDTIDDDGRINEQCAYAPLVGLDRFEARKQIRPALEASGNLVKIEDYQTSIGRSERTNAVVEPKLSLQWFVKMTDLREPAVKSVEDKDIRFYPDSMKNMYRSWMDGLRDWCVSRQLWWGHRIPAWYLVNDARGKETAVFVAETAEKALEIARTQTGNPALTLADLRQEEDVLDTWASSWLWPISVFDGFSQPEGEIKYYYPTNVLVTAPEIIFFWVARMIMAGYEYMGEKPFSHVYFTGIVRDQQRRKMSKSLGNSPDPLEIIAEHGADAVRYGMLSCASAGNDVLFDMKMVENGRNFTNKLWNALRLVRGWEIIEQPESEAIAETNALAVRWMREKFSKIIGSLENDFNTFHLSEAMMSLYGFIWDDFCSWYLEMIKPAYERPIDRQTYEATLDLYGDLMIALHPFLPFITEEIWHQLRERAPGDDCMMQAYPKGGQPDENLIYQVETAKEVIAKVRELRNQHQIKPREPLNVQVQNSASARSLYELKGLLPLIQKLAVLSDFSFTETEAPNSKSFIVGTEQYFVELNLEIDVVAERKKIEEELVYQAGFVKSIEGKLSNERFVAGAPQAVVDNERKKLADGLARIQILKEQLEKLG
ncbi:MAG: valine--tRNA ligase [Saprospiraceae bacterium]|nr:valine--tRNA ligase [Saprospiraceae bacterium]